MEVKHWKRFHPLKNVSLKWSFVLYVTTCVLAALLSSMWLSNLFADLQNNIFHVYEVRYQNELARQGDIVVDGEILQKDALWVYTEDLRGRFTARDSRLYDLYGGLSVFVVPVIFVLSVLAAGALFYLRKLKAPLKVLDAASARIAAGDLDFKVEYDCRNEFGRLASSFETMRESLHETSREMWRMMEGRKRLNAAFSHDLRTPLTVLRGYSDFLLKYVPEGKISSKKTISVLLTMDVYIKRLEGYNATMSALQKLEEIELSPKEVSFSKLCDELRAGLYMLASEKTMDFCTHGGGVLAVDMHAVMQTYENLVSNAIRYAKSRINVLCETTEGFLSITVADDGPGFTPEALINAANPYFRDEKAPSDTAHFGIGLYICRLLCEKHGGELLLENAEGGKITARFAMLPL